MARGNFASAYRWEDGIGLREQRPPRFDLAWRAEGPNERDIRVRRAGRGGGAEPFITVNAANGAPEEARWVEFCNPTRSAHYANPGGGWATPQPFNVRL